MIIENRFKLGQKVRDRNTNQIMTIEGMLMGYECVLYIVNNKGITDPRQRLHEDDLEEVREPLLASFECEWRRSSGGAIAPYMISPQHSFTNCDLNPFIGKRTKVTITEILEEEK